MAGLHDGAIKNSILGKIVVRVAIFPIILGVEVRTRLFRICDAVEQCEVACIIDRRKKFEGGMKRGESVSGADCVGVTKRVVCRSARRECAVGVKRGSIFL